MKRLADLANAIPGSVIVGAADTPVTGVAFHSNAVQPGHLFVAIPGLTDHGLNYLPEALERGAIALATELPPVEWPVAALFVPEARSALAVIAAELHDRPGRRIGLIGVTGTDGKTTTVEMIATALSCAGIQTDFRSTVEQRTAGRLASNTDGHTTPDAAFVQRWLADAVTGGARFAVLEVSSHALALSRVDCCEFDVAVLTTLSPEHLNFHGSLARYILDKARLFRMLDHEPKPGVPRFAVVNGDDRTAEWFIRSVPPGVRVIRFGFGPGNDVAASAQVCTLKGTRFRLSTPTGERSVRLRRTIGRHNVANWLAAAALCEGLGVSPDAVAAAAETFEGVRGRLQAIEEGQPFDVYVDFAHTPAALSTALDALRPHGGGRQIVVFGHAGGRDRRNRRELGRVAVTQADFAMITTDDPGDEDPCDIAAEVEAGAVEGGGKYGVDYAIVIGQAVAIAEALDRAGPADVVLIAGRGHEESMPVGVVRLPFDDAQVARSLLRARGYRPLPPAADTGYWTARGA